MRQPRAGYVLLEVLVGLVILGVTLTAILGAFIQVIGSVRDRQIIETGSLLAESLMEDLEVELPEEGEASGWFVDDPRFGETFEDYSWEYDIEAFEPDYDDVPNEILQELELVYELDLRIYYHYGKRNRERREAVRVNTYLMEPTIFTDDSLFYNQLY